LLDQSPKNKSQTQDIEKILFDLEFFMNSKKYNRRKVCTDSASEKGKDHKYQAGKYKRMLY